MVVRRFRRRFFLAAWRKHRGLSQEDLAERAGVTQGLISQLETGKTDYTGETLEKLAKALDCEPGDLLRGIPAEILELRLLDDLPPRTRVQAVEIIKALKRTAE